MANEHLTKKSCMYCDIPNKQVEVYIVRKAVKPKGMAHRWKDIGYCCESCNKNGKSISIDFNEE